MRGGGSGANCRDSAVWLRLFEDLVSHHRQLVDV